MHNKHSNNSYKSTKPLSNINTEHSDTNGDDCNKEDDSDPDQLCYISSSNIDKIDKICFQFASKGSCARKDCPYSHSKEAIETLYDLMLHGSQEGVRLGAARALLDKALPDVKSVEITGEDHGPLLIKIIEDTRTNIDE